MHFSPQTEYLPIIYTPYILIWAYSFFVGGKTDETVSHVDQGGLKLAI